MTRKRQPARAPRRDKAKAAPASLIYANVIPKSASGRAVVGAKISVENIREFLPRPESLERARTILADLGFQIDIVGSGHIGIRGSRALYERVFKVKLAEKADEGSDAFGKKVTRRRVVSTTPPQVPQQLAETVETIEFPGPIVYHMPISPTPPTLLYDHMELPEDVARAMDAVKAHARGVTGAGINLAMVDSGFMQETAAPYNPAHPYFTGRGYDIRRVSSFPYDSMPGLDLEGHGTAMAACILAVAPGVTFKPYKVGSPDGLDAFERAVADGPDIISCSWGVLGSPSTALRTKINDAVMAGIVVIFSCGNKSNLDWPGYEPSVISVGGAFLGPDDSLQASTEASSGTVMINGVPRQVPDLCGICGRGNETAQGGKNYHGILIAMPTRPSSADYDVAFNNGNGVYPAGDQTPPNDGWFVASGTSAAAATVAGVAALLLQNSPALKGQPTQVLNLLKASCRDVIGGQSASGHAAVAGPDLATGAGLVQAYRAIRTTDLWIKDNPDSDVGLVPTHNRRPAWPPFAHWNSPDIKVFSQPLGNPPEIYFDGKAADSPIFGQDNYVYVRARNRGRGASPQVTVELFYGDPGTNLIFPADWKDGQSGVANQGSITVGGAGTNVQTVTTIAADGAVVLPAPFVWRPPNPTLATQSQVLPNGQISGHFCLLVRLSSVDDQIIHPGGTQASVINDNNIGMSNQQVISLPVKLLVPIRFTFYMKGAKGVTRNDLLFDLSQLPQKASADVQGLERAKVGKLKNATSSAGTVRLTVGQKPTGFAAVLKPGAKTLVSLWVGLPSGVPPGDYPINVMQASGGQPLGGMTLIARLT